MEPVEAPKYITFRHDEFFQIMKGQDFLLKVLDRVTVTDAVVIRRQDFFASPALGAYANCIALVARTTPDQTLSKRLIDIADYFHQQSELAAEEGWKFPD